MKLRPVANPRRSLVECQKMNMFEVHQELYRGVSSIAAKLWRPAQASAQSGSARRARCARQERPDEAIRKFTGGKTPAEGKVKLDMPEIAENGATPCR
jgi:hypothetical protein